MAVDDIVTRRRFAPIETGAPEGDGEGAWGATFPVPADLLDARAVDSPLPAEADHQRGLDALMQAREGFDVLAEVVTASRAAVVELERRLADESRAREVAQTAVRAAATRELALHARMRELERQSPAAGRAAKAGAKVLHSELVGRAGAGMQRFARNAAAETAKLRTELANRSQEAAAELEAAQAERDRLAAALAAAEGERDTLQHERDALREERDAAAARVAELTAAIEAVAESVPPEAPAPAEAAVAGEPTPIRFTMGADTVGDAAAVHTGGRSWTRAGIALLVFAVVVAVGLLLLTGYGAYCSNNPCG